MEVSKNSILQVCFQRQASTISRFFFSRIQSSYWIFGIENWKTTFMWSFNIKNILIVLCLSYIIFNIDPLNYCDNIDVKKNNPQWNTLFIYDFFFYMNRYFISVSLIVLLPFFVKYCRFSAALDIIHNL